jgi:hypothetical protein
MTAPTRRQLVEAPASDAEHAVETLGYLDAYDEVINDDYAFVAYRETHRASGDWWIRIESRGGAGALFEPSAVLLKARAAGDQGLAYFSWGSTLAPSAADLRHIEYRVHIADGQPAEIEICLQTRKFDHTADQPKSIRLAWPAPASRVA